MPPIASSPQGSRAGLITSLVIFVILFVTSTIIAIHFYTQFEAAEAKGKADVAALTPGVTANVIANNKDVGDAIREATKRPPLTGIEYAIDQKKELAKLITANPAAPVEGIKADTIRTVEQVRTELKQANAPVTVGDDNLLSSLKSLAGEIVTLAQSLTQAQSETKAANEKVTAAVNERAAALAEKDKEIASAKAMATEAQTASTAREGAIKANVDAIQKAADTAVAAAQAQTTAAQAEVSKLQAENKKLVDLEKKSVSVLNKYRLNPSRSLLQPAGVITRVPGNNTVFINLGEGQQISPGLTFEVYDSHKGLPSLTTINPENPDELPAGKASIEVIRILPGTSECRIIRTAPGQQIVEGDLVLNLIYNTHTRFAFMVYGDFDLANAGQPSSADADVVRRLITQWGGRVMDQVNVDTDFVVLGKEPVVLPLPEVPTPLDQERHDKQQKALDNYTMIQSAAIHLNIPILNQNRFLYFVGYYDQAKR